MRCFLKAPTVLELGLELGKSSRRGCISCLAGHYNPITGETWLESQCERDPARLQVRRETGPIAIQILFIDRAARLTQNRDDTNGMWVDRRGVGNGVDGGDDQHSAKNPENACLSFYSRPHRVSMIADFQRRDWQNYQRTLLDLEPLRLHPQRRNQQLGFVGDDSIDTNIRHADHR